MKTSLLIDDRVFEEARKESISSGKSISEIISGWARAGRNAAAKERRSQKKDFQPLDLGVPTVDLSSRRNWMEELEGDGD